MHLMPPALGFQSRPYVAFTHGSKPRRACAASAAHSTLSPTHIIFSNFIFSVERTLLLISFFNKAECQLQELTRIFVCFFFLLRQGLAV